MTSGAIFAVSICPPATQAQKTTASRKTHRLNQLLALTLFAVAIFM